MTARDVLDLVWIVPALPLLGAVILMPFGRRIGEPVAGWIATGLMALSFVWTLVVLVALRSLPPEARSHTVKLFTWLPSGGLRVSAGFLVDPLSITFALFVTGVAALIHLYSIGYMHGDRRFGLFFGYTNLFAFMMLVLVLASSFLFTFVGWEGVGLCSYLLISFWYERSSAAVAGKKAFVTTRVGDVGFMVAMFLIFATVGSLDYAAMSEGVRGLAAGTATGIALLLFAGAVGKSAQIPLHVWLPDAMEGPTPVSALIHAATMVTAGVFLVARAHPFFEASGGAASTTVAWVGAATALLAGSVAVMQPDIKRILAYSTISQLGYMFLALGVHAYGAAIFLVVTHAFYKATLFLGAGSVIHGLGDNQDIRTMGGLRRYLPITTLAFGAAWLAIAGIPGLAGFWSKDEVLAKAFFADQYALWAVGVVAALLTGLYMTREMWLVFFGNERFRAPTAGSTATGEAGGEAPGEELEPGAVPAAAAHAEAHAGGEEPSEQWLLSPTVEYGAEPREPALRGDPHRAPFPMAAAMLALGALSVVGGLLSLPFKNLEFLVDWLEPVFSGVPEIHASSFLSAFGLSTIAVVVGLIGLFAALAIYGKGLEEPARDPLDERLGVVGRVLGHAYYFDESISNAVRVPGRRLVDWLSETFDQGVIDGAVNGVGRLFRGIGLGNRKLQSGLVRQYALGIALGAVGLLIYVWVRTA